MTPVSIRTADRNQIRKLSITARGSQLRGTAGTTSPRQHWVYVELRGIRLDRDPPISKEPGHLREGAAHDRFSQPRWDPDNNRFQMSSGPFES